MGSAYLWLLLGRSDDQTWQRELSHRFVVTPSRRRLSYIYSLFADVHFSPQGSDAASAGRTLLENYIQGVDAETSITGSTDSTSIKSLQMALSEIVLSPVTIPAIHDTLIKSTSLTFPTDIVNTSIARASFILANPFTASINLLTVGATATYRGLTLGTIQDVDVIIRSDTR